jgi:pimeloyl-ACP methyl ester carboxylesterase
MWIFLLILVLAPFGLHFVAKNAAQKIKSAPNPIPYETLQRPLQGTPTTITRNDGTRIHAISNGSGKTVVLAHGYGVTMVEWNVIAEKLVAAGYRIIAFDLRGHGQSTIGKDGVGAEQMAGDYRAVLEHFDVRDGILVGHSTGGFLTLVFLVMQPQVVQARLRAAVICAGLAGQALKGSPQNALQIPLIKRGLIQRIMQSDTYGWFFGASLCGDVPFPAAIQVFNQVFAAQNHQALMPVLEFLTQADFYPRLPEIQLPAVIVCGEADKTTPTWHSQEMGNRIPHARNIWVPKVGHLINWEAPDKIVEAIQSV